MVYEELLEYSAENLLHVRIKGSDHPVLQSCLVDDTDYVATSALKNFHPAIFGSLSPYFVDLVTRTFQLMSREDISTMLQCTTHLKNSATSPAITLDFAQSFGSISEQLEWQKEPQNFPIMDPSAGWEWIAHYACTARGVEYTKQHAELADEILQFANEVQMSLQEKGQLGTPQTFPVMLQELLWSDKALKLQARLRDIESGTQNDTGTTSRMESGVNHNYQQFVTPENHSDESERGRNEGGTSPSNDGPNDTETNCGDGRRTSGDLESTVSPSTMPKNNCYQTQQTSSTPGAYDMSEDKSNAEHKEDENESQKERQSFAQKEKLISTDQPRNPCDNEDDEKSELERSRRVRNCWLDHLSGIETVEAKRTPSQETKFKYTEAAQRHERIGGIDFVPAFRSRGWPKVARDWIKRERKWPSPEMVDKIIQEGYHLVAKPPKKSGNPDCDFRISFSHAEYLLSQEMNDIQRECYRCLKKFHRAHLSKPEGLVTFHLKNMFLQTIEETGAELWTESNRAMCMMKLLGNLLEALTRKDLRHYFVRTYNLFEVDYIEDPEILEALAGKVQQIIEHPPKFSKKLIKNQEDTKQAKREERVSKQQSVPSSEPNLSASGHRHGGREEIPSKGNDGIHCKEEKAAVSMPQTDTARMSSPIKSYRYHDLKEIFLDISNELIDMAFNDSDLRVEILDSLERSLVNDLRELVSNHAISVERLPKLFDICWDMAYNKVWLSTEPDMRRRMLVGIQGQVEMWKYMVKQEDFGAGNEDAILNRMFDPSADNPFDLNHIMPADAVAQLWHRFYSSLEPPSACPQEANLDDIPLD
ncbi:hypothetical protein OS493_034122 [Desmophyllum pertusum]|uniref:Uncharacterized protein n=1 Tax=Desmophyllum pertusum TaxID=174260 RepID=A0A9X0CIA0_9CNID|nr:hypothetical protein OS493_034122 [Desmophyllum pertusum]